MSCINIYCTVRVHVALFISYMVQSNRVIFLPENMPRHILNAVTMYNIQVGVSSKTICFGDFEKNRLPLVAVMKSIKRWPKVVTCAAFLEVMGIHLLTVYHSF